MQYENYKFSSFQWYFDQNKTLPAATTPIKPPRKLKDRKENKWDDKQYKIWKNLVYLWMFVATLKLYLMIS